MYFAVVFPVTDLRGLHPTELERLPKPNWGGVDPQAKFVRGFGAVQRRIKAGLGFPGEEYFADCTKAIAFPDRFKAKISAGEPETIPVYPLYQRFFFDGIFAGRFELGFRADEEIIEHYVMLNEIPRYDPELIASQLLNRIIRVDLPDGRGHRTKLRQAAHPLGEAYLLASTKSDAHFLRDALEQGPEYFSVSEPFVYVRAAPQTPISSSAARRKIGIKPGQEIRLSRTDFAVQGFNVIIQTSPFKLINETDDERALRLVYTQLRSLIASYAFYSKYSTSNNIVGTERLRLAVTSMVQRLETVQPQNLDGPELPNISSSILSGESIDVEKITKDIQATFTESRLRRTLAKILPFLDRKSDVAIEASAAALTNYALRGGQV